jgi:hypothetical protein
LPHCQRLSQQAGVSPSLARNLKLIKPDDYETLAQQTTEIKRMLTVFVQKLTAEG